MCLRHQVCKRLDDDPQRVGVPFTHPFCASGFASFFAWLISDMFTVRSIYGMISLSWVMTSVVLPYTGP